MNGPLTFLLHAKARMLPLLVLGASLVLLLVDSATELLHNLRLPAERAARVPVTTLIPLVVSMLLAPMLTGRRLDPGPRRRWIPLSAAAALCTAAFVFAGLDRPFLSGAMEVVRNTSGCFGLVAIGTIALGARLGWAPTGAYLAIALVVAPAGPRATSIDHFWAWPMYSPNSLLSGVAAVMLCLCGLVLVALATPVRRRA